MSFSRLFHKREYNNATKKLARIITVSYEIDCMTGILSYGATIFTNNIKGEQWSRQKHIELANTRLEENPVTINFGPIPLNEYGHLEFFHFKRLEKFIRNTCLPIFGVYLHNDKNKNPKKCQSFLKSLPRVKAEIFDQSMTSKESAQIEEKRIEKIQRKVDNYFGKGTPANFEVSKKIDVLELHMLEIKADIDTNARSLYYHAQKLDNIESMIFGIQIVFMVDAIYKIFIMFA